MYTPILSYLLLDVGFPGKVAKRPGGGQVVALLPLDHGSLSELAIVPRVGVLTTHDALFAEVVLQLGDVVPCASC